MESMVSYSGIGSPAFLRSASVLITGHTGFKGSWLAEWLLLHGARVAGVALPPESPDALFCRLGQERRLDHNLCDIRDLSAVSSVFKKVSPDVVFHMAAQSLVRRSYREPVYTWETNVVGSLNVLEAARALRRRTVVVVVTTDKVYKNREWEYSYRECDELGGRDPYSASKAACELAVASWRESQANKSDVVVMTVRAGNVIGGGDVCEDRIVPDCFRAWSQSRAVQVRNPRATRPWQHVLEPLSGYCTLAERAHLGAGHPNECNFGPGPSGERSVEALVTALSHRDPRRRWLATPTTDLHEANALSLSIERARLALRWQPTLSFEKAVAWTDDGYSVTSGELGHVLRAQIEEYEQLRRSAGASL